MKRQKNDMADAEAICEAAQRPTMRFVQGKSAEAQGAAVVFRTRDLVRQRTQLINGCAVISRSSASWCDKSQGTRCRPASVSPDGPFVYIGATQGRLLAMSIKSLALAVTFSLLAGGAALAAEACSCCKDGEKTECCDKMKDQADTSKPADAPPAQPEHKH